MTGRGISLKGDGRGMKTLTVQKKIPRFSRYRESGPPSPPVPVFGRLVFFALLLGSLALVFRLLLPFMHSIILALLLASFFGPAHQWILAWVGGRRNLAALLGVALVFTVFVAPVTVFTSVLVKQGIGTVRAANAWIASGKMTAALHSREVQSILEKPPIARVLDLLARGRLPVPGAAGETAEKPVEKTPDADPGITNVPLPVTPKDALVKPGVPAETTGPPKNRNRQAKNASRIDTGIAWLSSVLPALSKSVLSFAGNRILPLLSATWAFVVGFMIMLFVLFFALRDGRAMLEYLRHLSPLSRTAEDALLARIRDTTRAVVLGTGATAVAQGLASMIAFRAAGIPALFWGAVLGASSIVPVIGTALVWVPAVGYLLLVGKPMAALFVAGWCMVVVGSIDNFLRPLLMGERVGMSSMLVFFSILGGLQAFGPVGVLYGPLIFGLCAVCLYIYELENSSFLTRQDQR